MIDFGLPEVYENADKMEQLMDRQAFARQNWCIGCLRTLKLEMVDAKNSVILQSNLSERRRSFVSFIVATTWRFASR
jgi:hypothetical protein